MRNERIRWSCSDPGITYLNVAGTCNIQVRVESFTTFQQFSILETLLPIRYVHFFFQFNFNKSANRQSFHFQKIVGTLKIKKKKRDICKHSFLLHSTLIQVVVTASHFGNWSCTVSPIVGRSRSWQLGSSKKNFHFKCTVSGSFDIA